MKIMDQTPLTDGSITVGGTSTQAQQTGAQGDATVTAQAATPVAATPTPADTATPAATTTAAAGDDSTSLFDKFDIPEMVRTTYPDLVPLILQTESMNDDERQYWFQILPIMTDDQVKKLRDILSNEKQQLAEIDKQYNKEVKEINEKHVSEWKEFEHKDKRERLKTEESKQQQSDASAQDQLLSQLNNI